MQKSNKIKFILAAIFVFVIVFGVGKGEKAKAETYTCLCPIDGNHHSTSGTCEGTQDECNNTCKTNCTNDKYENGLALDSNAYNNYLKTEGTGTQVSDIISIPNPLLGQFGVALSAAQTAQSIVFGNDEKNEGESCNPITGTFHPFKCPLLIILKVETAVLSAATTVFVIAVNPDIFKLVVGDNNTAIYEGWTMVRDVLNVSFIMFLLFSAFATVFQIEKYNYKKTLLMIVIMALLVNFSFPITRFIIDVSNMLMYYFIESLNINTNTLFANFSKDSAIDKIITTGTSATITSLLISVIFVFILATTLVVIAILLVIRVIALALLIIFSSLAFIGAAIPPLSSYASDWWKKLFNYAFFGPIMIFMLYISSNLMKKMVSLQQNFEAAAKNTANSTELVASMAYFGIPIIILWLGLGIAQSMSIEGAGAVVGQGKKFMGWAGKTFSGYRYIKPISKAGWNAFDRNILGNKLHISPRQFIEAWKESTKEAEESKLAYGKGLWHDRLNNIFSLGKQKTNYAEQARQALVSKKMKTVKEVSEESGYLLDRAVKLIGHNSPESVGELKSILRILFSNNDQDELMGFIKDNIEKNTDTGKKFKAMGFDSTNWGVSEDNVGRAVAVILEQSLGKSNAAEEEINKELLDLGNIAAVKQGAGFASSIYDTKQKKLIRLAGNPKYKGRQGLLTAKKMMTMGEAQNIPKQMHRNNFTDENGNLNDSGKALLRTYASPVAIKHIERHKNDFYESLCLKEEADGETMAQKMLKYSFNLKNGTADGWDVTLNGGDGGYADGIKNGIKDEKKGLAAAAWTVALQIKAGVEIEEIKKNLLPKAGFTNPEDIKKIMELARGPEELPKDNKK